MSLSRAILLVPLVAGLTGCPRGPGGTPGGPDAPAAKPTEEEIRQYVRSSASRLASSYGGTPISVTLLSPLYPVPDLYFTKREKAIDPIAVCCYVAIRSDPIPGPGKTTVEFVVFGRETGPNNPLRGQVRPHQTLSAEYLVRDFCGKDWLAEHPWPKVDEKKKPAGP